MNMQEENKKEKLGDTMRFDKKNNNRVMMTTHKTVTDYFYLWKGSCHWLVVEEIDRNPKEWPIGE